MNFCYVESPVGRLLLGGDDVALRLISFPKSRKKVTPRSNWTENRPFFEEVVGQLNAYFDGKLKHFSLQLVPHGTPFQLSVLDALRKIPYGETVSYGELARRIGRPRASRAVGAANAANPLPIVIPCHRVIGSDGSLTGFGGGLDIKRALLDLEKRHR